MRIPATVLLAPLVASCSMAPPQMVGPTPAEQASFANLTAGKVAGAPLSCLPNYRANDMVVIDENTIAFRDGGRVYVNRMEAGCTNIDHGRNTLVTHSTGSGPCRGDVAQVFDTSSSIPIGSCVFGDFTPYARPGR